MNMNDFNNILSNCDTLESKLDVFKREISDLVLSVGDETYLLMAEDIHNKYYESVLQLCNRTLLFLLMLGGVDFEGKDDEIQ